MEEVSPFGSGTSGGGSTNSLQLTLLRPPRSFMILSGTHRIVTATGSTRAKQIERYRSQLVETLRLLAADFETQVDALPRFVHIPDEIALLFGDEFLLAYQILAAGRLTSEQYAGLEEIDDFLDKISGHQHLEIWTLEALERRPEWQRIRSRARDILNMLGEPLAKLNLDWVTYVSSRADVDPTTRGGT